MHVGFLWDVFPSTGPFKRNACVWVLPSISLPLIQEPRLTGQFWRNSE